MCGYDAERISPEGLLQELVTDCVSSRECD